MYSSLFDALVILLSDLERVDGGWWWVVLKKFSRLEKIIMCFCHVVLITYPHLRKKCFDDFATISYDFVVLVTGSLECDGCVGRFSRWKNLLYAFCHVVFITYLMRTQRNFGQLCRGVG